MAGHGQQGFHPGLCLSFLCAAVQTAMQAYPTAEPSCAGCRGHNEPAQMPTAALRDRKKERKAERMSRNSRSTNSRSTPRSIGRHRQTGGLTAAEKAAGRFPVRESACKKAGTGSGMRYYNRSHYAATGAASLARRAGRRY